MSFNSKEHHGTAGAGTRSVSLDRPMARGVSIAFLRYASPHLLLILIVVGLWELLGRMSSIPSYLLPLPSAIAQVFWSNAAMLLTDAGQTLLEATLGFVLGMAVAIVFATAFTLAPTMEKLGLAYIVGLQCVPLVVLAPVLAIWCGSNSPTGKVLMAAIISIPPATTILLRGLKSAPADALMLMDSLAASKWQTLIKLRVPSAVGYGFAAAKVCASLSTVGALVAEFSGSTAGLGFRLIISNYRTDTVMLFSAAILAIALGLFLYFLVAVTEVVVLRLRPYSRPT